MNEERYELTPKGIAYLAALQTGLISSIDDPRIDGFWTLFETRMYEMGYVQDDSRGEDISES